MGAAITGCMFAPTTQPLLRSSAAGPPRRQRAVALACLGGWIVSGSILSGSILSGSILNALMLAPRAMAGSDSPPQIARDNWKDCVYNNSVIRCQDQQQADSLRILWIDGIRSFFVRRPPSAPGRPSYWGDRHGGLWRRELLPQGNTLLTNLATGNRILIPLRLTCQPPLKGEVGYCRY